MNNARSDHITLKGIERRLAITSLKLVKGKELTLTLFKKVFFAKEGDSKCSEAHGIAFNNFVYDLSLHIPNQFQYFDEYELISHEYCQFL